MNTRIMTAALVALTMVVMAMTPLMNNAENLDEIGTVGYDHGGGVANETAILGGTLTWQDGDWDASWSCNGGLALVTPADWSDFLASSDNDPHNYTSWGLELTGAGSYYTAEAPAGEWVVTAGLGCIDDAGESRSAGGQYGDVHENPPTVNLTNDTTVGDVSFTLIEHGGGPGDWDFEDGYAIMNVSLNPESPYDVLLWECDDGGIALLNQSGMDAWNWSNIDDDQELLISWGTDVYSAGEHHVDNAISGDWYVIAGLECWESGSDNYTFFGGTYVDAAGNPIQITLIDNTTLDDLVDINLQALEINDFDDERTFICGNGDVIPFEDVNDGDQDCPDGADEQQYNATDGSKINWYDCEDGTTQVWIDQVNDGNDDCPGGDDEERDDISAEEAMAMFDADGDGNLSFVEIIDAINNMNVADGEPELPPEAVDMINSTFNAADADGDGLLNLEEVGSFIELMNDAEWEDDGPTFVCGNGDEIPFDHVNDGDQDCTDGSDEQQFDADGDRINWFDCHDGSEVWVDQVNDGTEDCPDGEDEGHGALSAKELLDLFDSDGDGNLSLVEIIDGINDMNALDERPLLTVEEKGHIESAFNMTDYDGSLLLDIDELEDFIDLMKEVETDGGDGEDGPACDSRMVISFQQNVDNTADLTFANTCTYDANGSADMMSYLDADGDGMLSADEINAAQDAMANRTCYGEDGTEVPCGDDEEGLFSFDGIVLEPQPMMGDGGQSITANAVGLISMSSIEVVNVPSNVSLYSHTFEYDAGADWDGGHEECSGGIEITAASPWSVSNVSFSPESDWVSGMHADGSGWSVENIDADGDGDCKSEPSSVRIVFTAPEPAPEPVVDTTPTCDIFYHLGDAVLAAGSTWSVQLDGAVSFEVPSDGEFTLALPVGEYSVVLACNDAESDAIDVSVTDGNETWGGTAQNGVIYAEGFFRITEDNVTESVDITLTWSSTDFGGTFNLHFTAVESIADAIEDSDIGGLPGFTASLGIMAMLGAAMILARRKV